MGKKILVADDSLTIQKVVELTFSESDYELTCVSNGRQALERVGQDRPDLILADVVMPERNGYEVCEELKRNPETAGIPVILLAGTFEPFDRDRAERLGCAAVVSKPFDARALVKKVESLLSTSRSAERMPSPAAPAAEPPLPPAGDSAPVPPPDPYGAGFAEEDFTGSIRNLRGGRGRESLEDLYGPEDVESAIAAFREVEPSSAAEPRERPRATDPIPAEAGGRISRESIVRFLDETDAERTNRIDLSSFRYGAPPPSEPEVAFEIGPSVVESLPPRDTASADAPPRPAELCEADIERLAAKVVEKLSERVVREVAWEVIPEMAELVIERRIKELESGVESVGAGPADPGAQTR